MKRGFHPIRDVPDEMFSTLDLILDLDLSQTN